MLFNGVLRRINKRWALIHLDKDADIDKLSTLLDGKTPSVDFDVEDGRTISPDQRKKIYAMIGEIDVHMGNYLPELTKIQLKYQFSVENEYYHEFSFSDCSISLANKFIEFLIDYCLRENVPFLTMPLDMIQEQYNWDMKCLEYRKCIICGKHADIAHVYAVGIGRNRNKISHIGNYVMALCREHHTEQHGIGIKTFMDKYQVKGLKITPEIAEMLKIGKYQVNAGDPLVVTDRSYLAFWKGENQND